MLEEMLRWCIAVFLRFVEESARKIIWNNYACIELQVLICKHQIIEMN